MKSKFKIMLLFLFTFVTGTFAQKEAIIQNSFYEISVYKSLSNQSVIKITKKGTDATRFIKPEITLRYSDKNPNLYGYRVGSTEITAGVNPVAAWNDTLPTTRPNTGFILNNSSNVKGQELSIFKVANGLTLISDQYEIVNQNQIVFRFKKVKQGEAYLSLRFEVNAKSPIIEMGFKPTNNGWYSLGFTGLMPRNSSELNFLYQPLAWSWRRFPTNSFLTPEAFCYTAATFINDGQITEGIAPDPSEIPYRFATINNSRFGLALRNEQGKAQPMIFAPILGGEGSWMEGGKSFTFKCNYILEKGDWYSGIKYVLNDVFHYKNERQNKSYSLNETLENMIDFAMGTYGGWVDSLKASDYKQDVPGSVKNVSALHPLSIALVTGNEEIYAKRALPMMEYIMSREKFLYAIYDEIHEQNPSRLMNGPCAEIGELAGLFNLTGNKNEAFVREAKRIFGKKRKLNLTTESGGGTWMDHMSLFRLTNDSSDFKKCIELADIAIEKTVKNYPKDSPKGFFPTEFTPKLYDFLELYELTGFERYLNASAIGAHQLLLWMRSNPMAPDSTILINKGGVVQGKKSYRLKLNSYENSLGEEYTLHTPEQIVPAWHTSLIGLPPEATGTSALGPVMLTHHAPFFLRLAHLTKDSILANAAYNAVIGRYANFPGYYFNSLYTNVHLTRDYPLRDFELRQNNIFYNHVWPHIAMLMDFLVSDAYRLSKGKINFPSTYAPGYAYLTSKVYGQHLGNIYNHSKIRLWNPSRAVKIESSALNHLCGADNENLYLILMNTSQNEVVSKIELNPDIIPYNFNTHYQLEAVNEDGTIDLLGDMNQGEFVVKVPMKGIVVIRVKGLKIVFPQWVNRINAPLNMPKTLYIRKEIGNNLGTITGMVFHLNHTRADAYFYTSSTEKQLKKVEMHYRVKEGEWQKIIDNSYPFEFSLHLPDPNSLIEFQFIGLEKKGLEIKSEWMKINE